MKMLSMKTFIKKIILKIAKNEVLQLNIPIAEENSCNNYVS
jgi:hypothetical protein